MKTCRSWGFLLSAWMVAACSSTHTQTKWAQEGQFALAPPLIHTGEPLFRDSVRVEMKLGMPGVEIFYSLDGSLPGAGSLKYERPFYVTETSTLRAMAIAEGWLPSAPASVVLRRMGGQVAEAFLAEEPAAAYAGEGAASLIDGKKGSANFGDGRWLGYEGADLQAILDLGEMRLPHTLWVSCLEDPGSWIFYPAAIEVAASHDGITYHALAEATYDACPEGTAASLRFLELTLPGAEDSLRFLRVEVHNRGRLPDWHPGAAEGGKPWLFVDEVLVGW